MFIRWMIAFAHWFSSPRAVMQVTVVTLLWVAIEAFFPHLDPNGFFLMYIFTLWSGWSQNILAYAANVSAEESRVTQSLLIEQNEKIEQLVKVNMHQNEVIVEMVQAMVSMQRQLDAKVEDIAGDIDDIKGDV